MLKNYHPREADLPVPLTGGSTEPPVVAVTVPVGLATCETQGDEDGLTG